MAQSPTSTGVPASGTDPGPAGYRYLPHTADEILEAWGDTKESCISQLATGFVAGFASLRDGAVRPAPNPFEVELGESAGMEETVVALLEEILFVIETEGEVPIRTEVTSLTPGHVEGVFYSVPLDSIEEIGAVPKAISYADFSFEETGEGNWRAKVTIDV